MELDILYYLVMENTMLFTIGLDILKVKNVVLHGLFLIIMHESKFVHAILCL